MGRGRDAWALASAWLAVAALVTGAWLLGAFRTADLAIVDAHFSLRGDQKPDPRLVLVGIDPETLQRYDRYPLPRGVHARLIDRLRDAGAAVIAYDVVFAERGPDPDQDDQLITAIQRAGNVVLAASETDTAGRPNVLGGDPERVKATAGNSNFVPDRDGEIRRDYYSVDGLQTLAVATAERYGRRVNAGWFGGHGALIDYAGSAGTYPLYSFSRVEQGKVAASAFRGRIVVVGASDPNLQDVHATSTSGAMDGVEIQANAISSVLHGMPIRQPGRWLVALLTVLFAALAPLAALRRSAWLTVVAPLGAGVAYAALTQFLFDAGSRVLPLVAPLSAAALAIPVSLLIVYVAAAAEHAVAEERGRREIAEARARAADAADAARRGVERDLHDGAQQKLVALGMDMTAAAARARRVDAADELAEEMDRSVSRLREAIGDLRALSRGAYPGALVEGGIDGGLAALIDHMPPSVRLSGRVGRRLDERVEGVVYFFASEALSNALKHAHAERIDVSVNEDGGRLRVVVADDGAGGADPAGSGLRGLSSRLEAVGASMTVESVSGGGTRVAMEIAAAGRQG